MKKKSKKVFTKPEFTVWKKNEQWVSGTVGCFRFHAKLYDEGSRFGIKNGRVSKLSIADDNMTHVNYDRGWDKKPSQVIQPYYEAVMLLLENSPKDRF